jgi:hypothetical protein
MARIVLLDELVTEGSGGRRPLWLNVDHVVYFRAGPGGATELALTTGETLRVAGDPKTHASKLGLPLGRVMGSGV